MKLRSALLPAVAGLALVSLTGCVSQASTSGSASSTVVVGTSDKVTALDPAGSWDNGSATIQNQVFRWLLTSKPGATAPEPDIAKTAAFTSPTQYTVTLKDGQKFANGHDLTATDVVFSFERQLKIANPNGPSSLLSALQSVKAEGSHKVTFTLKTANDQLWPQILTSPAGAIVDEQTFSPTKVTSDNKIIDAKAFDGQYTIDSYKLNSLVSLKRNERYDGILGRAKSESVLVQYFTDETNLKLAVQKSDVDLAFHTLSATDIDSLRSDNALKVHSGPGAEMRFIAFNFDTMPFGAKTANASPAKALAVRQAMADLIDRQELAKQVYKNTYKPAFTQVPSGLAGSTPSFKERYGDGTGGADESKAADVLRAAGITEPVTVNLQYNTDHYGADSGDEYALIKGQLEQGGLFSVDIQSTEWTTYATARANGEYPVYQLGWFADYPDSDNYLNIFYGTTESPSLLGSSNDELNALVQKERTMPEGASREAVIEEAQDVAATYIPTIPLLQGTETVVANKSVKGIDSTLDASFRFRFGLLSK